MPEALHPRLDTSFLDFLAESLNRAVADNGGGFLVHVVAGDDGPEVGILPLDGQAPADALLGAVAPEHWSVLGVATTGKAVALDRPRRSSPADRVEVVVLVGRDGTVVGRVRQGDRIITEAPGDGATLDCLQRAFGLPTAPPDVTPAHLLTLIWLERVLGAAQGRRHPLRWSRIAGLHPAGELLGAGHGVDLVADMEELGRALDWGRLRALVVAGSEWRELGLTQEEAAWFDDGSFSRWVIGQRSSVPALLAELRRVLPSAHAQRCARLLHRLGAATTRC